MSNVTGQNIDLLKSFFNLLNPRMENFSNEPAEFQIDDIYSVPGNNFLRWYELTQRFLTETSQEGPKSSVKDNNKDNKTSPQER